MPKELLDILETLGILWITIGAFSTEPARKRWLGECEMRLNLKSFFYVIKTIIVCISTLIIWPFIAYVAVRPKIREPSVK